MEDVSYKNAVENKSSKCVTMRDIENSLYIANLKNKRQQILLHNSFDEIPQRFINCLTKNSYIRPHMHTHNNQWELISLLYGDLIVFLFNKDGIITDKIFMNKNNLLLIEIKPCNYHTFLSLGDSAYLEIRNCKYDPTQDRIYAHWAPEEYSEYSIKYHKQLLMSNVGDKLTI